MLELFLHKISKSNIIKILIRLNHSGTKASMLYEKMVSKKLIQFDSFQHNLIKRLEKFYGHYYLHSKQRLKEGHLSKNFNLWDFFKIKTVLTRKEIKYNFPKGFYFHGDSGTGKTLIMELFYKSIINVPKRKTHYHSFISNIHSKINDPVLKNLDSASKFKLIAKDITKKSLILYIDEFQVTDIADAVIMTQLFSALFREGIILLATSNRRPEDLYKNGIQRELFLPFIKILKRFCEIVSFDSETDYRERGEKLQNIFFWPLNATNRAKFEKEIKLRTKQEKPFKEVLKVTNRKIIVHESYQNAGVFEFIELCGNAYGTKEYQAIVRRYKTVFIRNVRAISLDESDLLRRFVLLVDAIYAAKVVLIILSEVAVQEILEGGKEYDLENVSKGREDVFSWKRCRSRLLEMQTKNYLS